jgi:stage II sporulation protein M
MATLRDSLEADLRTAWAEHRRYVWTAAGIFGLGILLGIALYVGEFDLWAALGVESPRDLFPGRITVVTLLLNNTIALAVMVAGALTLGLLTVFGLTFNGVLLGFLAVPIVQARGIDFLVVGILPHGVLELPSYFVAGGIGLRLVALAVLRVAGRRDHYLGWDGLRRVAILFAAAWVVLAVAAVIELFVTAALLEALYG